jgi:hypothetical protein
VDLTRLHRRRELALLRPWQGCRAEVVSASLIPLASAIQAIRLPAIATEPTPPKLVVFASQVFSPLTRATVPVATFQATTMLHRPATPAVS